jgi:hypothetical protein
MGWWDSITSVDELPKLYPDEAHIYTDATEYITYNSVVLFDDDDPIVPNNLVSVTLPLYTIEATTWNFGNVAATLPRLTASGQRGNSASADLSIPVFTAAGMVGSLSAELAEDLPMLTISAAATQANLVRLAKSLPMFKIAGNAYQYNYGNLDTDLPMMTIAAAASMAPAGALAKSLPMITVYGEASVSGRFGNVILRHSDDLWGGVEADLPMMTISAGAS